MIERITINSVQHPLFPSIWEIYETSFPLCERRILEDQIRIFANNTYHLQAWVENKDVKGIIGEWNCDGLRFVEHYAISSQYRSMGYGSIFLSEWIADNNLPVLLEIEPVVDEITQRRQNFYMNLGFIRNNIKHVQPAYHKETNPVELWIMSYPRLIAAEEYRMFYQKQCFEIMPKH